MPRNTLSASLVALALLALATMPGAAAQPQLQVRSVGDIFVDAQGRASGQNLATSLSEAEGLITGFSTPAATVFDSIRIEGFEPTEKIQGAGSPRVNMRGSNAVVTLHDNLHSLVKVSATEATAIHYGLASGISAVQEGARGGVVRIMHDTKGEIGHLVVLGAEGARPKGETVAVKAKEIVVRAHATSDVVFLAKPPTLHAPEHHRALVAALAEGALASQYVTEFSGGEVAASQADHAAGLAVRTSASAAGTVSTSARGASAQGVLLAYDLAYETLPAKSASELAVYVDGQLATRAASAREVLSYAKSGVSAFHASVQGGRSQVLASVSEMAGGERRVTVSASAHATTESQAQAQGSAEGGSRVYGGFEHHANGKLTGSFVTGVLPQGHAELLSFTALPLRTEIFQSVRVDGGASASFLAAGPEQMLIHTTKADLTLVDDVHATMILAARAPVDASYTLAPGIRARLAEGGIVLLEGAQGALGALVLAGPPGATLSIVASGEIATRLGPGSTLLYRGAPDAHPSEGAVLRALAESGVGAQLLAGLHEGAPATKVTRYHDGVGVSLRAEGAGGFLVDYRAERDDAPRAFVLDARGGALLAKSASDIRVSVDGVTASPVATPEEALDMVGFPRYHASTSAEGALRVIVNVASSAGRTASVAIESLVNEEARAQARTDAFGAFRLFHDGTAIGSFVTLKADREAGALAGLTMLATGQPIFASLVAGSSPYVSASGDGTSALRFENREARLELSDTTSGFAQITALSDTSASFRLAAGLRAEQRGPSVVEIHDAAGAHVASLVLVGGSTASSLAERGGRDVDASLARGATILFRAHAGIETELSAAQRTMINQAMAAGHIAGQIIVQTQAKAYADSAELERTARAEGDAARRSVAIAARHAHGEITSAVTATYGAVTMVTAATKQRVEITVASTIDVGQTILVSLDPDTIPGMAQGKAVIRFDGQVVAQASSYADILDPNDDDGIAEYFVLAGDAGTQVLVSVPHFSVHTVTLEEQTNHPNSLYMYATLVLGLVVVVEGAFLARNAIAKRKITLTNQRRL